MSENDNLKEVIEATEGYAGSVGDQVQGDVTNDDTGEKVGFHCSRGQVSYLVVGNPDVPFLTIQFPGDLVSGVADIIDESDAQEILPEEALPTGSEDLTSGLLRREAAVYVLDQQDNELMGEVEYEMSKVLSSTETSFGWRRTAKNTFAGFDVQRKVFPYRDRFDIAEFDAATRAVVAVGNSGANYLKSSIIGGILTTAEPLSDSSSEPDLKSFQ